MALPRQVKGKPFLKSSEINRWPEEIEKLIPPGRVPTQVDKPSSPEITRRPDYVESELARVEKNYLVPIYDPDDATTQVGTMTIAVVDSILVVRSDTDQLVLRKFSPPDLELA